MRALGIGEIREKLVMAKRKKGPWYEIYLEVQPMLDAHSGNESINLLIQKLATQRNYDPKVLTRMISAGRFLDRIIGKVDPKEMRGGYAHIEYIHRLHSASYPHIEKILKRAIAKKITLHELKKITTEFLSGSIEPDARKRSLARSLIAEHERHCAQALQYSCEKKFGVSCNDIIHIQKSELLGQCFIISKTDKNGTSAIFPRLGDTSRKLTKSAADVLKLARNARYYFDIVWIVFPESSKLAKYVVVMAEKEKALGIWLRVATLKHKNSEIVLSEIILPDENNDDLMDEFKYRYEWEGRRLSDKAESLSGHFELRASVFL